MLAATAYLKLNSTDLFLSYFLLEPMLLLLNVLPPILLIWFFYFLTRRAWAAFLGSFPLCGTGPGELLQDPPARGPLLAADLRLVTEAGGIVGHYQLDLTWLVWLCAACLILGLLFSVFLLPCGIGRGPLRWFCLCSSRRPAGGVLCGPLLRPEPV